MLEGDELISVIGHAVAFFKDPNRVMTYGR